MSGNPKGGLRGGMDRGSSQHTTVRWARSLTDWKEAEDQTALVKRMSTVMKAKISRLLDRFEQPAMGEPTPAAVPRQSVGEQALAEREQPVRHDSRSAPDERVAVGEQDNPASKWIATVYLKPYTPSGEYSSRSQDQSRLAFGVVSLSGGESQHERHVGGR